MLLPGVRDVLVTLTTQLRPGGALPAGARLLQELVKQALARGPALAADETRQLRDLLLALPAAAVGDCYLLKPYRRPGEVLRACEREVGEARAAHAPLLAVAAIAAADTAELLDRLGRHGWLGEALEELATIPGSGLVRERTAVVVRHYRAAHEGFVARAPLEMVQRFELLSGAGRRPAALLEDMVACAAASEAAFPAATRARLARLAPFAHPAGHSPPAARRGRPCGL
jgi:hypothetical protein